jgi:hypothetical protein
MNKEPKFHNKDGSLTAYAFACGYIEREVLESSEKDIEVELYKDSLYHVRAFNLTALTAIKICWESFETLTEARKFYKKTCKELLK